MYDYSKLKGRIVEILGTQKNFAEKMELSNTSIISKMAGRVDFTQGEIKKASKILAITIEEIPEYFFKEKVQKKLTWLMEVRWIRWRKNRNQKDTKDT